MNTVADQQLQALAERLGHTFSDLSLLRQALTHRSAASHNNERLEFLGDSLLNFIIAEALFSSHTQLPEGDLSRLRAHLVKGDTLAQIAREIGLSDYLILGGGELKSGGYRRDSILADAVEAIIAAVYLDAGISACRDLVLRLYHNRLQEVDPKKIGKDAKTRLQEWLQKRKAPLPQYEVLEIRGPAHDQTFHVACYVDGLPPFEASAGSRRKAEQLAAEKALAKLDP
ncbi:MAG TPA: ribonuclease III [Sulfurivirga caldicuralii]|nr:ribonuclease III [Sulfurivirga caldicuralii]